MVSMDACVGLVLWFPEVPCSIVHARERVDHLLEDLERRKEKILIPAPALAEILVHAGEAGPAFLDEIQRSTRFQIGDFDVRAAIEVASAIDKARREGNRRGKNYKDNWQKIKYDHQILAISKVAGASVLYTNDAALAHFATTNGMEVLTIANLPLPPDDAPLFAGVADLPEPRLELPRGENALLLLEAPPDAGPRND